MLFGYLYEGLEGVRGFYVRWNKSFFAERNLIRVVSGYSNYWCYSISFSLYISIVWAKKKKCFDKIE